MNQTIAQIIVVLIATPFIVGIALWFLAIAVSEWEALLVMAICLAVIILFLVSLKFSGWAS